VAPPLQSEVVESFSWYGVYSSPAVCHWREPVVSRILSHNQRLVVPRVLYPDNVILSKEVVEHLLESSIVATLLKFLILVGDLPKILSGHHLLLIRI
jgi:hypothetical protein